MIGPDLMVNDSGGGSTVPVEDAKPAAVFTEPSMKALKDIKSKKESKDRKPSLDSSSPSGMYIRRPLQGMSPKKDTYASLTVTNPYGSETSKSPLVNSSTPSGKSSYTTNFLIQSISESRQEKAQPVPTFGDTFYYFFGQQPVQIQVSAILLNAENFEWELEWWHNYSKSLRGTKLVDYNRRVALQYESTKITGFISTCSIQKNANSPMESNLSFTMFVDRKMYSTSLGREIGSNTFTLDPSITANIHATAGSSDYFYTDKLNTTVLSETINFLKNAPDIETAAYSNAIFGEAAGPYAAAAVSQIKTGLEVLSNPLNSIAEFAFKKENEVSILASSAFSLNLGETIASASLNKGGTIKTSYKYSDILGEYVSTPAKGGNAEEFFDELLKNMEFSMNQAFEELDKKLAPLGFKLTSGVQENTSAIPEGGLAGGYKREIERRKNRIREAAGQGLLFQASVGLLEGRRALVKAGNLPDYSKLSSLSEAVLNSNSEV